MKKTAYILMIGTVAMILSSCKTDEAATSAVTNDEAAEMVSMSLSENSMGATAIIETSVGTAGSTTASNVPQKVKSESTDYIFSNDTTYTASSKPGAIITYSLTATYGYQFTVNLKGQITSASENYTYSGSYDAPRLASTHNGSGTLALTNMNTSICTVNGTFIRIASTETKGASPKSSNSETHLNLTDIMVNKSTATIQSGSATLTITGSVPNKGDFSYTGSITFNGDNMATLVIKDTTYTVNLKTGDYTAN
ncbi:MAG: hypothetical protein ACYC25_07115 [Paludibacter sp.]